MGGSSASDSSGSEASSGSKASGSSGSYFPIWLWLLLAALLCCCCLGGGGAAASMTSKKPKKRTTKKKPEAVPEPVAAVEAEAEPLVEVPPLMPLATTSSLIPAYSMMAAPAATATAYVAPAYATTDFAAGTIV